MDLKKYVDSNGLQVTFDAWSAEEAKKRSENQMTLGGLIDYLCTLDPDREVGGFDFPHSFRGYYRDLAFEMTSAPNKISELVALLQSCMGEVFEGYKGGHYMMGRNTPVWFAEEGSSSGAGKIIGLNEDGTWETKEDEY